MKHRLWVYLPSQEKPVLVSCDSYELNANFLRCRNRNGDTVFFASGTFAATVA